MIDSEFLKSLPQWAVELAEKYFTHTVSQFVIHGAIRDLVPQRLESNIKFESLKDFLINVIFPQREFIIQLDRASGFTFPNSEMAQDFTRVMKSIDVVSGTTYHERMPRDVGTSLNLLEKYMKLKAFDKKGIAVIIDYAETIVPAGELAYASADDRNALITLRKWANDPQILNADITICLLTESLQELNPAVVRNPYTAVIEIELPDKEERLEFITAETKTRDFQTISEVTAPLLAELTSGLSRIHIRRILSEAIRNNKKIEKKYIMDRKKELIESECYGLLEFIQPKYSLDMVAGHEAVKTELRNAAKMIQEGYLEVLPMGYLICGPVGTGKTFMVTCFTGDIGIPCVTILNFRSKWQGVTEANMQKILSILKAMGPLGVIIDEADAFLGDRNEEGDSGTSSRVFSQIASFMSNTDYRGKVIWFLLTARPDLLPVDLKRQGRAEEHLALFHPVSDDERQKLCEVFIKKNKINTNVKDFKPLFKEEHQKLSGADIESVCIRAKKSSFIKNHKSVTYKDFEQAFEEFIPPIYTQEITYQILVAVLECTNRNLIPEEYRKISKLEIAKQVKELSYLIEK
ncbi:MAG: AAA family ATPase [Candidatus Schekmanbacteria bacterium RBG_13_48_7]|uniref:Uncharacterized AAA domain-containing protein ycf46 n=1 Tax=Candidatus Schekmanbacteria bacterium RBG_13_48_7 TaxID=1817878 RepID=A0A1F7S1N6_9BACT|nr:MAG: AAA family ATPase [Candidatus Schekmanbacteria bacterium RBG_13_48_7]